MRNCEQKAKTWINLFVRCLSQHIVSSYTALNINSYYASQEIKYNTRMDGFDPWKYSNWNTEVYFVVNICRNVSKMSVMQKSQSPWWPTSSGNFLLLFKMCSYLLRKKTKSKIIWVNLNILDCRPQSFWKSFPISVEDWESKWSFAAPLPSFYTKPVCYNKKAPKTTCCNHISPCT